MKIYGHIRTNIFLFNRMVKSRHFSYLIMYEIFFIFIYLYIYLSLYPYFNLYLYGYLSHKREFHIILDLPDAFP